MSFGKQSGPPASDKQVAYLLSLVRRAGHDGFRDARHPLGLTQRQAGGKFSGPEASALIDRLLGGDDAPVVDTTAERLERERAEVVSERVFERANQRCGAEGSLVHHPATSDFPPQSDGAPMSGLPADLLADELRRRGWTVVAP